MPKNLNNIIIYAFRYAIDRKTGASLQVANFIKHNLFALELNNVDEIRDSISNRDNVSPEWTELVKWIDDPVCT